MFIVYHVQTTLQSFELIIFNYFVRIVIFELKMSQNQKYGMNLLWNLEIKTKTITLLKPLTLVGLNNPTWEKYQD